MAGNRSITVTLRANVQDFKSQFDAATKAAESTAKATEGSAKQAETSMGRMVQSARENQAAWTTTGATMTGFGAAVLGGLGLATKAAMDWESAWAGVQKTVDGTAPQMEALEAGLRGMARELPASHQEIAAVAEAAGQLGIATPNVLGFTRTMIDMGEATNMSAEEAATSLARFMNVMGTSQSDVGRLGASVVGLGNNFATTESEIVAMSQRLSGAGAQANMTEGDVMGMAAAMSSVGIEAEAGGSAMSQTMKRIGKEVDTGGSKLELFAQVAGMSAEQFSTAWKNDPAMALDAFITGLSSVEQQGMTTNGVLSELGITGIRESDSLLRLSAAAGQGADGMSLLAEAIQMGNGEFDRGTALIEEASKRYETAESRIAIARNALVDLGISVGGTVLPVLANLAEGAGDVAGWFADLPAPVHEAAAGLGAVVGAGSLAAGTFLLLFPRVMETVSAFKTLNSSTGGTAATVGKIGLAVGVAAAAMPLLITGARAAEDALKGIDRAALDVGMEEMASRTLQAADATSAYDALLGDLAETGALNTTQFDSLGTSISKVADMDAIGKFGHSIGLASGGMDLLVERLSSTGEALGLLYQTDLPRAQESFAAIWAEAQAGGATFDQLLEVMPAFKDELQAMANMMGVDATDSAILFKIATGELTPVVDETTGAVTGFTEGMDGAAEATQSAADAATEALKAIQDLANEFIAAERGALDYKDAMSDVDEAIKENGKAWENGTEAADENKRALLDLAEQALATAASFDSKHESGTFLAQAREDLIDTAMQMGATREEAERYVDQLGLTPEKVTTQIELDTDAALEKWNGIWDELGYHPPQVPVDADTDPAKETIDGLVMSDQPPANVPVEADTAPAEEEVHVFGSRIGDVPTSDIPVNANVEPAQWEVNLLQAAINDAGGTVDINGNTVPGDQALATLMGIINSSDGTVTIDGMPVPAEQALGVVIGKINAGEGTVDIEGDPSGANAATDSAKRKADGTTGTIGVDANTGRAESDINRTARDRSSTVSASAATGSAESTLNRLARRRTAVISVSVSGGGSLRGTSMGRSMRAGGGPVFGPGTEVSDSIPAQLSHNEHVWAAREVRAVGGHAKLHNIRSQVLAGAKTIHLAEGGAADGSVGPVRYVPAYQQAAVGGGGGQSIDYSAMGAQMRAAVSGMTVALNLDGRTLYGAVVDSGKAARAPFVTRRG